MRPTHPLLLLCQSWSATTDCADACQAQLAASLTVDLVVLQTARRRRNGAAFSSKLHECTGAGGELGMQTMIFKTTSCQFKLLLPGACRHHSFTRATNAPVQKVGGGCSAHRCGTAFMQAAAKQGSAHTASHVDRCRCLLHFKGAAHAGSPPLPSCCHLHPS
jgi:hypothetical protein